MEEWKDITNYPGYQISSLGNVKSLNYNGTGKEKLLRPGLNTCGYPSVSIYKDGKPHHITVHRLVALEFIPNPYNYPEINHIDENKTNNSVENLEWVSKQYNIEYSKNMPILQYSKSGEFIREWKNGVEAESFGFNRGHISSCCLGKRKSSGGFIWRFKGSL